MRQAATKHEPGHMSVPDQSGGLDHVVCNPAVLWRRTASSVVVLTPHGEPTELIGAAAAVWDAVSRTGSGGRADERPLEALHPFEVEQIVTALSELELVIAA